ncbi:glutamate racemase [Helicobacter sp. 13S00477-4]|uniref:glutamate racemase n=1 Tax=Helicobacter sp. 13S00477-4 TaxID=1905759 RepID=UPI000BA52C9B|nr:glutamate racemase [Helicobacter sp. 13S00477-4]PAF52014.1 glutamate racemase [Helicobacter sp. 13S00477-4]
MKAGIFDSGVGGLSVLKNILNANLFDEIIYYGDTARVPYGVKDKETIINFSLEALDFFVPHQVDMLIIACNTVSAYALEEMKKKSPIPIIGVIEPGIEAVQNKIKDKNASILIIATQATIRSKTYQNKLFQSGYRHIKGLATGLFVPIVEEGVEDSEILDVTMRHYFSSILTPPEAIILGCTHFPLIADKISQFFNNKSLLIHSGEAIVQHLCHNHSIKQNQASKQTKLKFYASSNPSSLEKTAQKWLKNF